jgi:hypothetical protein
MLNYLSNKVKYIISQCSWRNLLSLNTLLKLIFMYFLSVAVIILCYFDYSPEAFANNGKTKIAIYSSSGRIGEHQTYLKSLKVLKKMNIEYIGCSYDESFADYFLTRPFYIGANYIIHKIAKPRLSISLTHLVSIVPPGYSLVYLNVPDLMLFGKTGKFISHFRHLKDFDGYIDLYTFVHGENKDLMEVLKNEGKENSIIIPSFLGQDERDLKLPSSYNYAVVTGTLWGCNRSSYRLISSLKKLGNEGLVKAYGMNYAYDFMEDAYLGPLEKYGKPIDAIIDLQREAGISLIFHNFEHLVQGLPTSRFAESIVSGAVIISDRHHFIEKYFGNNILYFDSFAPSEEIYNQIKNHILWIKANPDKAREMAKNSYDIFSKELSMEVQLPKVIRAVEEHLND